MFSREIARDKEGIEYALKKMEVSLQFRRTNNGKPIPEHALVVYMNINPSSVLKAYNLFQKEMNQLSYEAFMAIKENKTPNYTGLVRMPTKLMNAIQKAKGTKTYLDIDCDTKDFKIIEEIYFSLKRALIIFYTIETHGGFHFLINKQSLHDSGYPLHELSLIHI